MGDGTGNCTGSCAEVHHLGFRHSSEVVNDQLHYRFRFRTRNEDAGTDAQRQVTEIRDAGDVLQWDPSGSLLHQFPVAVGSWCVAKHHGP